jgi:hypothetical protein
VSQFAAIDWVVIALYFAAIFGVAWYVAGISIVGYVRTKISVTLYAGVAVALVWLTFRS